ncbi:MAG: nucleotidyltransferase family protein [Microcystaceae cyanobacterium]
MKKSESDLEQILSVLQHSLENLKLEYEVKRLGIFGSLVRDEVTPNSDLDLLVEFQGDITFDNYMELKFLLEDLFQRKIDLVIKEDIKSQIREQILEETVYVS